MHITEFRTFVTKLWRFFNAVLPVLFWILLIFAFDEPCAAVLTALAALIHESGHLLYLLLTSGDGRLIGVLSGFRIQIQRRGYTDEIKLLLAGPLFNLIFAIIALFAVVLLGEYATLFSMLNLATAVSNLLPVRGHDGYGIIRAILDMKYAPAAFYNALGGVSFFLTALLSLISLYLMDRCDCGYWLYALFIAALISEINSRLKTTKNGIL